jgi:hypothetical protein
MFGPYPVPRGSARTRVEVRRVDKSTPGNQIETRARHAYWALAAGHKLEWWGQFSPISVQKSDGFP